MRDPNFKEFKLQEAGKIESTYQLRGEIRDEDRKIWNDRGQLWVGDPTNENWHEAGEIIMCKK